MAFLFMFSITKEGSLMKLIISCFLAISCTNALAEDVKIYQQNSSGNAQYHQPSAVILKNGRIIQADPVGNKQYQKQQYQIKSGKIYETDSVGNIQYHKPSSVVK